MIITGRNVEPAEERAGGRRRRPPRLPEWRRPCRRVDCSEAEPFGASIGSSTPTIPQAHGRVSVTGSPLRRGHLHRHVQRHVAPIHEVGVAWLTFQQLTRAERARYSQRQRGDSPGVRSGSVACGVSAGQISGAAVSLDAFRRTDAASGAALASVMPGNVRRRAKPPREPGYARPRPGSANSTMRSRPVVARGAPRAPAQSWFERLATKPAPVQRGAACAGCRRRATHRCVLERNQRVFSAMVDE